MVRTGEGETRTLQDEVAVSPPDGSTSADLNVAPTPRGARERIAANLAARRLEEVGAEPTSQERAVLARWTSWGAVPQIFDESDHRFAGEREQLRDLLDLREWKAASRTTLNAHYTAAEYTEPMWEVLSGLGFTGGQVLEPGCGAGAFLSGPASSSQVPDGLRLTGVELDPTTAKIARALHPQATVRTESFAESPFRDDTFDA